MCGYVTYSGEELEEVEGMVVGIWHSQFFENPHGMIPQIYWQHFQGVCFSMRAFFYDRPNRLPTIVYLIIHSFTRLTVA